MHTSSPRQHTTCTLCGDVHHLGQHDCDGHYVGYIDTHGVIFASRTERDAFRGGDACFTAWQRWSRGPALVGHPEPNYPAILRAADVLPEHDDDAMEWLRFAQFMYASADGIASRRGRARLN